MAGPDVAPQKALAPTLGLATTTLLVVGSVVGSGIFLTPGIVAGELPSEGGILLVWAIGGLLSLAGALTIAELGGMFPRAGGQYVFLREAYGEGAGFLFGWMALAVNYSGTVAAVAAAFAIYVGVLADVGGFAIKLIAIAAIWGLTAINLLGVRQGGAVSNVATVAKVGALLLLVGAAFLIGPEGGSADAGFVPVPANAVIGFVLALTAALFAFDGLASATFVAGEVKDPARTVPRATILAALVVLVVYLLVTGAFLRLLPLSEMAGNGLVAFDAGRSLFGGVGGMLIAGAIVIATFGTLNAYVLQSPRIYYAMAREGAFYQGFGRLHPRTRTPAFGLIIQAEWASLLVLTGTFADLITYVVMSSYVFFALTGIALFVLRARRPELARPYRVFGYPWVPGLFVLSSVLIVVTSLVYDTRNALIGVGLALSGLPIYLVLRSRQRRAAATSS